ncbi:hypothetical protein [Streptomyces sp. NPDC008240]|uniref:hypothetical protein n=1 Tax=Streptomyces sp. NPDC008240 TaxID=3364822 RepID=UPI0036EC8AA6
MSEPIRDLETAVRELGALPMPVGTEPRDAEDELTGARLSLYEEEQDNARLRLAWKSARHWRRELRLSLHWAEGSRLRWRKACIEAEQERDELRVQVAELQAERHTTNEALSDAAEALREQRDQLAGLEALDRKVAAMEQGFEALKAQGELLRQNAAEKSADKLTRLLAPREPEGEFHSFLHHRHTTPHDLPPLDGAR